MVKQADHISAPLASHRLAVAGGGTGGHLFPGIAVAQEFIRRDPENRVLFISTGRPFERTALARAGFALRAIAGEGLKGRSLLQQLRALFKIPQGFLQSLGILHGFKPHAILGVGSYAAGPVLLAARLLGIPCALHEQNSIPGITNRLLAPLAQRIYISFRDSSRFFNDRRVRHTGNPIRPELQGPLPERSENKRRPFTIFILGGSQGAHAINMAVIKALKELERPERYFFIHQTGEADFKQVQAAYRDIGISGDVRLFFEDMADPYSRADLIICRAGATTLAEITALGKGSVLIPFPYAADDHQVKNAAALADLGAAEMILEKDLSGPFLARRIIEYAARPETLRHMAQKARTLGKPAAAKEIVDDLYCLMQGPKKRRLSAACI